MPHVGISSSLIVVGAWLACSAVAEPTATLVDDLPGAGRLAAPATGQTLFVLDDDARTVTAVDPRAPAKRWQAVGPADLDAAGSGPVRPAAIACVDSNTLAVVCRAGADWTVRVFRLAPPGTPAPAPGLLQTLPLGSAPGAPTNVDVFVSDTRDWLAVVGLPPPLPPLVRAPIAGARLGGFSERLCPPVAAAERLGAVTASPFDEWVLFSSPPDGPVDRTRMVFHANSGRQRLLDLDVRLAGVRDAAYCRSNGTLWVVASGDDAAADTAGLWRIDAVIRGGRQAALPVAIAVLPSPLSVVCLAERAIAVSGGGAERRVVLVDPAPGPASSP